MPRFPLKLFFKNRLILVPLVSAALLNLAIWIYLLFSLKPTAETVFLHYTVHLGVDLVGPWFNLLFLPLLGLILILINLALSYFIYDRDKSLCFLILFSTPVIQFFLMIEAAFLIFLNH